MTMCATALFVALDTATGEAMDRCQHRHRHQEFLRFLRHIESQALADLDVHRVLATMPPVIIPRCDRSCLILLINSARYCSKQRMDRLPLVQPRPGTRHTRQGCQRQSRPPSPRLRSERQRIEHGSIDTRVPSDARQSGNAQFRRRNNHPIQVSVEPFPGHERHAGKAYRDVAFPGILLEGFLGMRIQCLDRDIHL